MTKVFFTSDHHAGHHNIIKFCDRPFSSVSEMEKALIDNHNSKVNKNDLVYFLGDVAMGNKQQSLKMFDKLNGQKILVVGNHDNVFGSCDSIKYQKNLPMYEQYFTTIVHQIIYKNKELWQDRIVLDHFPHKQADIQDTEYEVRYKTLRPDYYVGSLYLHGHTHSKEKISGNHCIHVGVDAWDYTPVSIKQLREVIEEQGWYKYSLTSKIKYFFL